MPQRDATSLPPAGVCRWRRHDRRVPLTPFVSACRPVLLLVIALDETNDVVLPGGLVSMVETHLACYFEHLIAGRAAASIQADNLVRSQRWWWPGIYSSSTCLCCLRRRPQHGPALRTPAPVRTACSFLRIAAESHPCTFNVCCCFPCGHAPPTSRAVTVHPPTAGAGVMCIDGGGARGISALVLMKRMVCQGRRWC